MKWLATVYSYTNPLPPIKKCLAQFHIKPVQKFSLYKWESNVKLSKFGKPHFNGFACLRSRVSRDRISTICRLAISVPITVLCEICM